MMQYSDVFAKPSLIIDMRVLSGYLYLAYNVRFMSLPGTKQTNPGLG